MADRQTVNVSLTEAQHGFIHAQLSTGRYRSASEVVREGLRMLEDAEQRRLLEKFLVEGLTPEEEAVVPAKALEKLRTRVRALLDEAAEDAQQGRVVDGEKALLGIRQRLESRRGRKSA